MKLIFINHTYTLITLDNYIITLDNISIYFLKKF